MYATITFVAFAAIILDFDGLIIDSETPLFHIWAAIYERHGCMLTMNEWQHALGTQGGFDPFSHLGGLIGETLDREPMSTSVREEHWLVCGDQPLLPGVRLRLEEA